MQNVFYKKISKPKSIWPKAKTKHMENSTYKRYLENSTPKRLLENLVIENQGFRPVKRIISYCQTL